MIMIKNMISACEKVGGGGGGGKGGSGCLPLKS